MQIVEVFSSLRLDRFGDMSENMAEIPVDEIFRKHLIPMYEYIVEMCPPNLERWSDVGRFPLRFSDIKNHFGVLFDHLVGVTIPCSRR